MARKIDWDKLKKQETIRTQDLPEEGPLPKWKNPYSPDIWAKNNIEGVRPPKLTTLEKIRQARKDKDKARKSKPSQP